MMKGLLPVTLFLLASHASAVQTIVLKTFPNPKFTQLEIEWTYLGKEPTTAKYQQAKKDFLFSVRKAQSACVGKIEAYSLWATDSRYLRGGAPEKGELGGAFTAKKYSSVDLVDQRTEALYRYYQSPDKPSVLVYQRHDEGDNNAFTFICSAKNVTGMLPETAPGFKDFEVSKIALGGAGMSSVLSYNAWPNQTRDFDTDFSGQMTASGLRVACSDDKHIYDAGALPTIATIRQRFENAGYKIDQQGSGVNELGSFNTLKITGHNQNVALSFLKTPNYEWVWLCQLKR